MSLGVLSPSGGLGYQLRAALNSKRWQPFRDYVEGWLQDWALTLAPEQLDLLVLVGPNAGHTISKSFVKLFRRVIVIEPDPVAYVLFEARFLTQSKWIRTDFFGLNQKKPNADELFKLFELYPRATFLFCNILGQLPVLLRDQKCDVEVYMKNLSHVFEVSFKQYKIASYHDLFSKSKLRPNEIVDHLTSELFHFARDKKEFPWQLSFREEHQIEFVRN